MHKNNVEKGKKGEDVAVEYLKRKGHTIVERNYYTRYGEIDIISLFKSEYHFNEVKYISGNFLNDPLEKLTREKIRRFTTTVEFYLSKNNLHEKEYSIDFIGLTKKDDGKVHLKYIENIF